MKNFLEERKEKIEKSPPPFFALLRFIWSQASYSTTLNTILWWCEEMLPEPSPPSTQKPEPKAEPHPRDTCEIVESWL